MKRFLTLLTIGLFIFSCETTDENPEQPNTNFNRQILKGYSIKSIAFDKLGNAWIGTPRQGLIKYNSKETIVFNSGNSIIPDSVKIWDIAVDSKNNVWFSCNGLIKYNGISFTHYNSSNSPIPEDYVSSITIDSKDNIWFSSSRAKLGGIVKYDNSNFTVFTPDNSELPVNLVRGIAIDKNDNVWIALTQIYLKTYLVKISGGTWTTYTSADFGFTPFCLGGIQINSKNQVCGAIGNNSCMGPIAFVFDGNTAEQLQHDSIFNCNSEGDLLTVDKEDNIWLGLDFGFAVYSGRKWIIDNSSFKETGVFAIEQAPDNKIWIGTGEGVYIND
jgi:ligand-binding sensor domain-containing protein